MKAYETNATVEGRGQIHLAGVPFAAGTEVEVTISPKRRSAEEFAAEWQRVCEELRRGAGLSEMSDEDIQKEIDDYKVGPVGRTGPGSAA
jgi:hypothetical protein